MTLSPVEFTHKELSDPNSQLSSRLHLAFGPNSLGLCIVTDIPSFIAQREALLPLASTFASLDEEITNSYQHPASSYAFGWSHGKEIMNGKPDTAKGSYYNNPTISTLKQTDEYRRDFPGYGYGNIWPTTELPLLEPAFMNLGQTMVDVGILLAGHMDKLITTDMNLPQDFFLNAIKDSNTHKARLLHYFPINNEKQKEEKEEGGLDNWCGLHVDHSLLTGLTAAMYTKNNKKYNYKGKEAGLYVKRRENFIKINIPETAMAFQIGECAEIASKGVFIATEHLVRGVKGEEEEEGVERNTFAVFMQPRCDYEISKEENFGEYSNRITKKHYSK